jgi:hypothetical protein
MKNRSQKEVSGTELSIRLIAATIAVGLLLSIYYYSWVLMYG